jgi:hypothetical protein
MASTELIRTTRIALHSTYLQPFPVKAGDDEEVSEGENSVAATDSGDECAGPTAAGPAPAPAPAPTSGGSAAAAAPPSAGSAAGPAPDAGGNAGDDDATFENTLLTLWSVV